MDTCSVGMSSCGHLRYANVSLTHSGVDTLHNKLAHTRATDIKSTIVVALLAWNNLAFEVFMMRNQRTYVVNQDSKHCLEDLCNDLRLSTSRNAVGEASKRSRRKFKVFLHMWRPPFEPSCGLQLDFTRPGKMLQYGTCCFRMLICFLKIV